MDFAKGFLCSMGGRQHLGSPNIFYTRLTAGAFLNSAQKTQEIQNKYAYFNDYARDDFS
jgi:hypothetical protein